MSIHGFEGKRVSNLGFVKEIFEVFSIDGLAGVLTLSEKTSVIRPIFFPIVTFFDLER
jgi:hypothetical protein